MVLRDVFIINGIVKIMRLLKIKFLIIYKRFFELNQEVYSFYIIDVCLMILLIFIFLFCDFERVVVLVVVIVDMAVLLLRRLI